MILRGCLFFISSFRRRRQFVKFFAGRIIVQHHSVVDTTTSYPIEVVAFIICAFVACFHTSTVIVREYTAIRSARCLEHTIRRPGPSATIRTCRTASRRRCARPERVRKYSFCALRIRETLSKNSLGVIDSDSFSPPPRPRQRSAQWRICSRPSRTPPANASAPGFGGCSSP